MSKLITASVYCNSVFDGTHDSPKPVEQGKLLITSKHISGGTLNFSTAYEISENDYDAIQKRSSVSQWDILFSMIGTVGEIYLEKNKDISYAIKNIGVFSCKNENQAKWLYYYLQSPAAKSHINRFLNGAVQKFLPLGALREFPVISFDVNNINLLKVLESLDSKIELNNRINTELEAMAKTLYDYWFVQFDFPDANGKPYKTSGGKMVYNTALKREIPEGWVVDKINNIVSVKDGTHDSPKAAETGYPLITSKHLLSNGIDFDSANLISEAEFIAINKRSKVDTGDILFSMIGTVGTVYKIEEKDINFAIKNVALYKTSEKIELKNYIYMYLTSWDMQRYMSNVLSGSIQKFIGLGALREMPLMMPVTTIKKFESITLSIFQEINNRKFENQSLVELRDYLLPMLMNGQVTVTQ